MTGPYGRTLLDSGSVEGDVPRLEVAGFAVDPPSSRLERQYSRTCKSSSLGSAVRRAGAARFPDRVARRPPRLTRGGTKRRSRTSPGGGRADPVAQKWQSARSRARGSRYASSQY